MFYEFEVFGEIKGKDRPRVNTYSGSIYTPNKTKDYENLIRQYFQVKYPGFKQLEGRISVKIEAYFKVPKRITKKELAQIEGKTLSPIKKPDIDNIVKIILDAMNKVLFKDDNQITKLEVEKFYTTDEERVYIKFEEY